MFAATGCVLTRPRILAPLPLAPLYSFDPPQIWKQKKKLDLCSVGVIFHLFYANAPISKGHVQESWQKERGQFAFLWGLQAVAAHPLL